MAPGQLKSQMVARRSGNRLHVITDEFWCIEVMYRLNPVFLQAFPEEKHIYIYIAGYVKIKVYQ